ncbi:TRAP transporter small permease subunit [Sedimentitalea sp. XS_ASV28]|uniref:TRAP transporter small permease subunit n=1 Tax=Sedimentitalea sp. XS_ASV28 TaxID=3241296 RepID=UPI00351201EF
MDRAARCIDRLNTVIGKATIWLLLLSVLVSAGNALARKFFSIGSNAFLELQWYLVGTMVVLGAAWVLREDAHVRIEVFSAKFPLRVRKWTELLGHLLMLVPFAAGMVVLSWPFFVRSWVQNEGSLSYGGLLVWPMRGIIVLGFVLLLLQAFAQIHHAIRALSRD